MLFLESYPGPHADAFRTLLVTRPGSGWFICKENITETHLKHMLRWPPCPHCAVHFDSSWHFTYDKLKQPWETRLPELDLESYWELRQEAQLWNSSGTLQLLTFSCTDQQGVPLIQDWSDSLSEGKWEARESHATFIFFCLPTDVLLPALPKIILPGWMTKKTKQEKHFSFCCVTSWTWPLLYSW